MFRNFVVLCACLLLVSQAQAGEAKTSPEESGLVQKTEAQASGAKTFPEVVSGLVKKADLQACNTLIQKVTLPFRDAGKWQMHSNSLNSRNLILAIASEGFNGQVSQRANITFLMADESCYAVSSVEWIFSGNCVSNQSPERFEILGIIGPHAFGMDKNGMRLIATDMPGGSCHLEAPQILEKQPAVLKSAAGQ